MYNYLWKNISRINRLYGTTGNLRHSFLWHANFRVFYTERWYKNDIFLWLVSKMYRLFQLCTSSSELRAKQLVAERGKTSLHRRPFPSWSSPRKHANTFTIFVFWNKKSRIKRTYFLLINLASAVLLVGITELKVLGAFKSEVMLESDIGHSTRRHQRGFWRGNDQLDEGIGVSNLWLGILLVIWCPLRGSWTA